MAKMYRDSTGYLRFKGSNVAVHRWMAEKTKGSLNPGEVVHHKDRNKMNNNPNNLHVCKSQAEHDRIHKVDAKRFGKAYSYQGKKKSVGFKKKRSPFPSSRIF